MAKNKCGYFFGQSTRSEVRKKGNHTICGVPLAFLPTKGSLVSLTNVMFHCLTKQFQPDQALDSRFVGGFRGETQCVEGAATHVIPVAIFSSSTSPLWD